MYRWVETFVGYFNIFTQLQNFNFLLSHSAVALKFSCAWVGNGHFYQPYIHIGVVKAKWGFSEHPIEIGIILWIFIEFQSHFQKVLNI